MSFVTVMLISTAAWEYLVLSARVKHNQMWNWPQEEFHTEKSNQLLHTQSGIHTWSSLNRLLISLLLLYLSFSFIKIRTLVYLSLSLFLYLSNSHSIFPYLSVCICLSCSLFLNCEWHTTIYWLEQTTLYFSLFLPLCLSLSLIIICLSLSLKSEFFGRPTPN